jgi:solute carrier family 25 uncoupling protein 27
VLLNLRYRGPNDCLVQLVRSEGAASMWKGFLPTYYRQALWNGAFWVSLEAAQRWLGLESI